MVPGAGARSGSANRLDAGLTFVCRRHGFSFVPEGEVYPLVLSFGIVVQSITFAVAQSTGLDKLFGGGCTLIAQMMLPGTLRGRTRGDGGC